MDRSRIVVMEDLCRILCETPGVQRTLERIVQHVAQKMGADVCSVYALNEEKEYLTLQATVGLSKESVGRVGMSVHEGLTGLVLEKQQPVFGSLTRGTETLLGIRPAMRITANFRARSGWMVSLALL